MLDAVQQSLNMLINVPPLTSFLLGPSCASVRCVCNSSEA